MPVSFSGRFVIYPLHKDIHRFYVYFLSVYTVFTGQAVVSKLTQGDVTYVTFINKIYVIDKSTVCRTARQVIAVAFSRIICGQESRRSPYRTIRPRFHHNASGELCF